MEMKTMWRERPIEELSREELIQALEWSAREIGRQRKDHMRTLDMWKICRAARS